MNSSTGFLKVIAAVILAVVFLVSTAVIGFGVDLGGTWLRNKQEYAIQKVDDATNYETLQKVENTARAMISSYESDKLTYEQYKDSDNAEKQSWAEQAKMRANKTATTYNNYLLENSFVWKGNIPADISSELPIIQ